MTRDLWDWRAEAIYAAAARSRDMVLPGIEPGLATVLELPGRSLGPSGLVSVTRALGRISVARAQANDTRWASASLAGGIAWRASELS